MTWMEATFRQPRAGGGFARLRLLMALALVLWLAGAASAAERWKAFRSPESDFSVLLPGAPKATQDQSADGRVSSRSYVVDLGKTGYLVDYTQFPPGTLTTKDPTLVLDKERDNLVRDRNVTLLVDRPILLGDYIGREIVFEDTSGYVQKVRVYVVKDRIYETISGGAKGQENGPDAKRFHDSFKFIEPAPGTPPVKTPAKKK